MPVKDVGVVDVPGSSTKFVSLEPSSDSSPVYVHIEGQTLRIPRDYIVSAFIMPRTPVSLTTGHWGKLCLTLMTVFPTFSSATSMDLQLVKDVLGAVGNNSPGKANLIWITRMIDDSIGRWRKIAEDWAVISKDDATTLKLAETDGILRLDTQGDDDALVSCCPERRVITGWGDLIEVAPGILYSCCFDPSLLPHWQEVHKLLTSFSSTQI
jgi:hypothetical protein